MTKYLFLLAILCIAMYGCPEKVECDYSLSYPYWSKWTEGKFISIVDDSLAVLSAQKYMTGCKNKEEITVGSLTGLSLVNYRVKQNPLSVDTFIHNFKGDIQIVDNYFRDSSVLAIDKQNKTFGFLKIGTSSAKFNKYIYSEYYALNNASPWIDGNVLLKNRTGSAWRTAVLDTKTGQIEQYDSFKGYEWLNECGDVSSIENKIACVKINYETESVELIIDGKVTDAKSLYYSGYGSDQVIFHGSYIIKRVGEYANEIWKIDTENFKFDNDFASIWIGTGNGYRYGFPRFYKDENLKDFVQYTYEDLFEANN